MLWGPGQRMQLEHGRCSSVVGFVTTVPGFPAERRLEFVSQPFVFTLMIGSHLPPEARSPEGWYMYMCMWIYRIYNDALPHEHLRMLCAAASWAGEARATSLRSLQNVVEKEHQSSPSCLYPVLTGCQGRQLPRQKRAHAVLWRFDYMQILIR